MIYLTKKDLIEFEGDRTVYHYTSIYTCIESIFPLNRLRLSPVTLASDPMEHLSPNQSVSYCGYDEDHLRLNNNIDGFEISEKINKYYKSLHQLCLCRNSEIIFEEQFTGVFETIDHFGFVKPRMWDQYGDKFGGVCIALSRKKLTEQLSSDFRIIDVLYKKYKLFKQNIDNSGVDLNIIEQIGEQKYLELKYKLEIKKLSIKHNDYKDENECKVITATEDNYAYIDISKCIQGIFFTNNLNYVYESLLKNTAKEYNIPLIQIDIRRTGINIHSF